MTPRDHGGGTDDLAHTIASVLYALVHSNLFIAVAATSWVGITVILVGLPFDPLPLAIVFAVTLFVYSFNRFTDIDEDEYNLPGRVAFTRRYGRFLLAVGTLAYAATVVVAIVLDVPRAEFLAAPLVVAVCYSVVGLKRLLLVKNLLVGVSWGAIPLGTGIYYGVAAELEIIFLAGYVTAMLTVAAVVFDVKDIEGDRLEGIRTIPQVVGVRATRFGAVACSAILAGVVLGAVASGLLPGRYLTLLAFNAYVCGYSWVASVDAGPLFYGFVVDGEHLFLALVVVLTVRSGLL